MEGKTRGGRDACVAVSQHISNEEGDMGERLLNSRGFINDELPIQALSLPF